MKVSSINLSPLDIREVEIKGCLDTREYREPRKNRRWWQSKSVGRRELISPLIYTITTAGGNRFWFDAPIKFKTNYYSYPLGGRSLLGKNEAAVGHDRLYEVPVVWREDATGVNCIGIDRQTADQIFLLLMEEVGTSKPLRALRHLAVRFGGQKGWEYCRGIEQQFSPTRTMIAGSCRI